MKAVGQAAMVSLFAVVLAVACTSGDVGEQADSSTAPASTLVATPEPIDGPTAEVSNDAGTPAPIQTADIEPCRLGTATGLWHTEQVCDSWEIVGPDGAVVHFNAINVRAYSFSSSPLDAADVAALGERFDFVRLNLNWAQLDHDGANLDPTHLSEVQDFLDLASAVDLGVILDVAHLGNVPGGGVFGIPAWAWPSDTERSPETSFAAWADNDGQNLIDYLDRMASAGVLTHDAVVAVEVVNEPHPRAGRRATGEQAQIELALAYERLRSHIQARQSELGANTRLVVLGSYYGGVRMGGSWTGEIGSGFEHNAIRDLVDNTDTIWTAHSYFTGQGDDDGHGDSGQQGEGISSETWHSAGCYASSTVIQREAQDAAWTCPAPDAREEAQSGLALDLLGQWSFAQDADRPFFMGEWGIARQRYQTVSATREGEAVGPYRGWANAHLLICDRLETFADVTGQGHESSWAFWSFDAAPDSFGIYLSRDIINQADNPDTYDLLENAWLDAGTFPTVAGDWAGQTWTYAAPFATDTAISAAACN